MFGRGFWFGLAMVLAVGVPLGLNDSPRARQWLNSWRGTTDQAGSPSSDSAEALLERASSQISAPAKRAWQDLQTQGAAWAQAVAPLDPGLDPQAAIHPLEEVLRFEVDEAWVVRAWPRVSARLAELHLQGFRVPLVTGTRDDDVAGSLTYYFTPQHQLERITLYGNTGDGRRLATLMTAAFGFQPQPTDDPKLRLYQVRQGRKVRSELRIWVAEVVDATEPRDRFHVALWLARPQPDTPGWKNWLTSALGQATPAAGSGGRSAGVR